ncbi:MAG: signal peptidase II [Aquiluna sp.]|nr:signal peptidase II [Aquiluna sp.]
MKSASSSVGRRTLFVTTALITLALDQITKILAETYLVSGSIPVIGDLLRFTLAYNKGAAFSLGFGATWILTLISSIAIVALLIYGPRVKTMDWALIAGFVLGGAAGNWIDRMFRQPELFNGHVVDFIQIPFNFPIFNLADTFLVIGVSLAVLRTALGDEIGGGRAK